MLCRCFHPLSVNTKTRARTEFKPVFLADSLSEKCKSAPSGPAALTSFGVRGAIRGGQLFKMKTMVWANRLHIAHAPGLREASARHRSKTVGAMPAHPTFGSLPNPRQSASRKLALWLSATDLRASTVRRAEPNPSFKLSPNGLSRRPSCAGPAAHCAHAVQRAKPSVPA